MLPRRAHNTWAWRMLSGRRCRRTRHGSSVRPRKHLCIYDQVLYELGQSQGKVGRNASIDIESFGGSFLFAIASFWCLRADDYVPRLQIQRPINATKFPGRLYTFLNFRVSRGHHAQLQPQQAVSFSKHALSTTSCLPLAGLIHGLFIMNQSLRFIHPCEQTSLSAPFVGLHGVINLYLYIWKPAQRSHH